MNLGFAVLYAAFAVVAVWLLAEVLLQHRAPLHWRLLALAGFLAVAGGVYLRNVPVIVAGVIAFGAGQLMVGRMHKLPGAEGRYWALRRPYPAEDPTGDFDDGPHPAEDRPVGEVGPVEPVEPVEPVGPMESMGSMEPAVPAEPLPPLEPGYGQEQPPPLYGQQQPDYAQPDYAQPDYAQPVYDLGGYQQPEGGATPVYAMEPLPEDSDNYGVYTGLAAQQVREQYAAGGHQQQYQQQPYEQPQYDQAAYDQQQYAQYQQQYSYDYSSPQEQQQYGQQQYAEQGYYVDEYGQYQPYPAQPQPQPHQQPAAEGYYAPES